MGGGGGGGGGGGQATPHQTPFEHGTVAGHAMQAHSSG